MLGNLAGALHLCRPAYTRGTHTPASPSAAAATDSAATATARSNSIDTFGHDNGVICRYCSTSRFEVGSDGNGDRS